MRGESYQQVVNRLWGSQKSPHAVPLYTRRVNRPLGRRLAALAYLAGLTPNQVTALSLTASFGGLALMCLAPAQPLAGLPVGLAMVLGYALDSADGQLARLTRTSGVCGEWVDHVSDQFRQSCLHGAVLIYAYRQLPASPHAWLLVPLAYSAVVSTRFLSQILVEQFRRSGAAAVVAETTDPGAALRSALQLPADPGVLCLAFLLTGVPPVFFAVYFVLFVLNTGLAAASLWRRYHELSRPIQVPPA